MRKLSLLVCLFLMTYAVHAQDTVFGPAPQIVIVRAISPDGNFVVGKSDKNPKPGFLWDVKSGNVITEIGETPGEIFDIADDTTLVGGFYDPNLIYEGNAIYSAGVWKNGVWTGLGLGAGENDGGVAGETYGSFANAITAEGNMVVGFSLKRATGVFYGHPTVWKRDGDKWVSEVWDSPATQTPGASIKDISADGSIAVGWTTTQSSDKTGIIWTSKTSYRTPLADYGVTEYSCISPNGVYAGFRSGTSACGIHNLITNEIILIEEGFIINGISDDGFAVGGYLSTSNIGQQVEKAFAWNKELGFIDLGEFVEYFLADLTLPQAVKEALTYNNQYFSKVQTISADGKNLPILIDGFRTARNSLYVLHIESPIVVVPFPKNLTAEVSRPDRNKVTLKWDAPETTDEIIRYVIYRNSDSINYVNGNTLTYIDEGLPVEKISYEVAAVYENKRSKKSARQTINIIDNYNLPFYENFDSINLETNYWTTEDIEGRSFWGAYFGAGVLGGTGLGLEVLHSQPAFETSLTSKPLDARNVENVYLSYMMLLRDPIHTPDTFYIDVFDGDKWTTALTQIFPAEEIMDWKAELIDLSEFAAGKLVNIRFRLKGVNTSIDTKFYFFDDIRVDVSLPIGGLPSKGLIGETNDENTIKLAWKDPAGLFGATHSKTSPQSAFGNEGSTFIAAQRFNGDELSIYNNMYLTSISAYIYQKIQSPSVRTQLKIAVFENGQRINSDTITNITSNSWNTFKLANPIEIKSTTYELIIGIEVVKHDDEELPLAADENGRVVKKKGDLFSDDNGQTWQYLSDNEEDKFQRNWSIIGNISELKNPEADRELGILGYNVYRNGKKVNDDLIYGQYLSTTKYEGCYTVRAYSLISGLSGESNEVCTNGLGVATPENNKTEILIYPNPTRDMLTIEGLVKKVTIFDMNGRMVLQSENQSTLSLGHLPSGVYLISIESDKGKSIQKLIIQ